MRITLGMTVLVAASQLLGAPRASAGADPVLVEVQRFLQSAADHATRSSACVDGSGHVASVEGVTVAVEPGSVDAPRRAVIVRYTAINRHESDTRGCGQKCVDDNRPVKTAQQLELAFSRAQAGFLIVPPERIPGLELLSPMSKHHDTSCYGDKPAWSPKPVTIPGTSVPPR